MRFFRYSLRIISIILTAAVIWAAVWHGKEAKQPPVVLQKDYARILFVGDLMFDRGIRYYAQKNGGNEFIFEKIRPLLLSKDLVVANLEGPITNNKSVSYGSAIGSTENYYFTFDPSLAKTLFDQNIKIVNLGNNHILNFGKNGLQQTKNYLDSAKVGYFGSPADGVSPVRNSSHSVISNGVKITFVSYNEFSEENTTIEEIQKAKRFSDTTIVFCHWGVEYSKNATDLQKELAHKFIDAGANLVVGSHPHVIGLVEEYNGKRIYYSLGNFVFDQYFSEATRNGLGVEVKIDKNKNMQFKEIKFYLDSNGQTILK